MWQEGAHRDGVQTAYGRKRRRRAAGVCRSSLHGLARRRRSGERVWVLDSGSTQHVTADRSKFTSYRKLVREEEIMGICGEPLMAVGVGEVELVCKTPSGVSTVTLREVRHAPEARASLFALTRATDAGARVVLEGRTAKVEMGGVVHVQAVQRGGLWEIETARKQRAFLARDRCGRTG